MDFSADFDLDALIAEEKALIVKPQIRFLWQHKQLLESYLEKASQRLGISFSFGYDGICLHPWRGGNPTRRKLTVTPSFCRLDYGSEEALCRGLDFFLERFCIAPDGRTFLPCGVWDWKEELSK